MVRTHPHFLHLITWFPSSYSTAIAQMRQSAAAVVVAVTRPLPQRRGRAGNRSSNATDFSQSRARQAPRNLIGRWSNAEAKHSGIISGK